MMDHGRGPTVVLMAGLPGAGKTTLALAAGRALGWPMLDKDTLKSTLLLGGVGEQVAAPLAYELMWTLADDLVAQGQSVILDSPARFPLIVGKATSLANGAGGRLKVVLCLAPHALRNQRMQVRATKPSQMRADNTTDDNARRWFQHLPPHTLRVDTARPVGEYLDTVLGYLRN